jgi:putative membrane protein
MKFISLKRTVLPTLIIGSTLLVFTSCETQNTDSKDIAEDQNEATFENRDAEKDADYLVDAAAMLQKNAELGKLAASKATMQEVKDLGSTLAKAHSDDLAQLQTLASGKSITLPAIPTENTMDSYADLNDKTGLDFDKEYCNKVVSSHKDAIDKMEKIEKNAQDADIRAWASNMLPELRSHLSTAEALHTTVKEKK